MAPLAPGHCLRPAALGNFDANGEDGMPFVYDETEIEWPEGDDEYEPPPPRADEFMYLPPPKFGGAVEPVRFSVAEGGELAPVPGEPPRDRPRHEALRRRTFAFAVPELRKAGVQRLYCRYDGGNDEGFAWLDRAEMTDGGWLDAGAISERLFDDGLLDRIYTAGIMHPSSLSSREHLREFLDDWLADEWTSMLLGFGYGTGRYSMYGAFTVDLETCTITDDRNADPVVKNIEIAATEPTNTIRHHVRRALLRAGIFAGLGRLRAGWDAAIARMRGHR